MTQRPARVVEQRAATVGDGSWSTNRRANLIQAADRFDSMTSLGTTHREGRPERLTSPDASVARGLLDREDLLELLDRAVTRRVTVVSAPPGSGYDCHPSGRSAIQQLEEILPVEQAPGDRSVW